MATELLSIKKYEFSDGTVIRVKVDYENNKVSLVDKGGNNTKFLFAERGVEFMNGWVNILGAMQYAIKASRDDLLAWQKVKEDKDTKQIIDIMLALQEVK
jgi:hypothetical protein